MNADEADDFEFFSEPAKDDTKPEQASAATPETSAPADDDLYGGFGETTLAYVNSRLRYCRLC